MSEEETNAGSQEDAAAEEQLFELVNSDSSDEEPNVSNIDNLDDALKELKRVRREAASRRTKNKDLEAQALKWREYEDSQKTELQRLTEAKAEAEKVAAELRLENLRQKVAGEYKLDPELIEFLSGDEQEMKKQASKLANKVKPSDGKKDFFAGQRGKPVTTGGETAQDAWAKMWHEASNTQKF